MIDRSLIVDSDDLDLTSVSRPGWSFMPEQGPRSNIFDPWYLILDTWSLILDPWSMIHDPWSLFIDTWSLIFDPWYLINDPWSLIHDPWWEAFAPRMSLRSGPVPVGPVLVGPVPVGPVPVGPVPIGLSGFLPSNSARKVTRNRGVDSFSCNFFLFYSSQSRKYSRERTFKPGK